MFRKLKDIYDEWRKKMNMSKSENLRTSLNTHTLLDDINIKTVENSYILDLSFVRMDKDIYRRKLEKANKQFYC